MYVKVKVKFCETQPSLFKLKCCSKQRRANKAKNTQLRNRNRPVMRHAFQNVDLLDVANKLTRKIVIIKKMTCGRNKKVMKIIIGPYVSSTQQ